METEENGRFDKEESYFALAADGLEEGIVDQLYVYGRWDREFGAWRVDRPLESKRFFPNWPLVNCLGNSILSESSIPIYDDVPNDKGASGARDLIHPYAGIYHLCSLGREAYFEAFNDFVILIPLSVRQMIGATGWCQWLLADAVYLRPDIQGFFEMMVETNETGFVRACFMLSRYWALTSEKRSEIVDFISQGGRGEVLHALASANITTNGFVGLREVDAALKNTLLRSFAEEKENDVLALVRDAPHLMDLEFRLKHFMSEIDQ